MLGEAKAVMAGLDPAIHLFQLPRFARRWMGGSRPPMES